MKTITYYLGICCCLATLSACNPTKQEVGTGAGAVVGGTAGSLITHGNPVAIIGGAAVGAVVGNQVGKNMDEDDKKSH